MCLAFRQESTGQELKYINDRLKTSGGHQQTQKVDGCCSSNRIQGSPHDSQLKCATSKAVGYVNPLTSYAFSLVNML